MAYETPKYRIVPWYNNPKKWAFERLDLNHHVGPFDTPKQAERAARKELGLKN